MRRPGFAVGFFLVISLPSHSATVAAYELRTHREITAKAAEASAGLATYLDAVGIRASDQFDPASTAPFDKLDFFKNTGTPRDWMIEGSIREDDYQRHPALESLGCDPPRNPESQIDRPLNHFFDVQRGGRGLTVSPLVNGIPAPDWALGRQGRGPNSTQNQFSILDARAYQLKSLTEPTREDREKYTALLFRTLGQVSHVLQDMAQPQHTRNDPHTGCLSLIAGEHSWYEDYINTRALGISYRTRSDPASPLPLGGYEPPSVAGYQDFWVNAEQKGLADFSSRNFFSAGTNLSLFGDCGGLSEPPCRRGAYAHQDASFSYRTVRGTTVAGQVRLFLRTMQDRVTGAIIPDVAVTSRSVWDQHLETRGYFPIFSLNTLNYDSISDVLLPRAVGYSAGLLDYFFRGKLDVDLVEDPVDPSVLRLTGTNASTDPLVDGTLTLFADDPNGLRSPALALDPTDVTDVTPGQALSPARFQAPANAERFLAVYQGTLGQEVKPSDSTSPGAVIGKVLGGVRVEEVFSDGTRWKIRTPKGVFLLPLTATEFEQVKWGDADNTLLAQTPFGPGRPNRFVVYEVQREPGSVEFKTLTTPDGPTVEMSQTREAVFPAGMSLNTTVQLSQTKQHRQLLGRYDRTAFFTWTKWGPGPNDGSYSLDHLEFGPLMIEAVGQQTVPFTLSFAIALDLDQEGKPYWWYLRDVAVDASGRLVAVVTVFPSYPHSPTVDIPLYSVNRQGDLEITDHIYENADFPDGVYPLLWALVDLSEGKVIASTAEPLITISHQQVFDVLYRNGIWAHIFLMREGGPQPGLEDSGWIWHGQPQPQDQFHPVGNITEVDLQTGYQAISADGWRRRELEEEVSRAGLSSFQLRSRRTSRDLVYDCVSATSCSAIRIVSTNTELFPRPARLWDGERPHPAPGGERMVFLDQAKRILVVWDPGTPRAQLLPLPEEGFYYLGRASQASVIVFSEDFPPPDSSILIPLEGAQGVAVVLNVDLYDSFTLLDPSYLYNVEDGKFYRLQPPLRRTALPAKLADVPGNPAGDYHTIRLP